MIAVVLRTVGNDNVISRSETICHQISWTGAYQWCSHLANAFEATLAYGVSY